MTRRPLVAACLAAALTLLAVTVPAFGGQTAVSAASKKVTRALKLSKRADKNAKAALAQAKLPGPAGVAGKDGAAGPAGANGKDGTNGADGKDGATGPAGPSASNGSSQMFVTGFLPANPPAVLGVGLKLTVRSRVVINSSLTVAPDTDTSFHTQCQLDLRNQAVGSSFDPNVGALQTVEGPDTTTNAAIANTGYVVADPGSYTAFLRCSDTDAKESKPVAGTITAIATGDAGTP